MLETLGVVLRIEGMGVGSYIDINEAGVDLENVIAWVSN